MSAATSNLHDQFHAMLQNMKQAPPPPVAATALAGGAMSPLPPPPTQLSAAPGSAVAVSQKDNIGVFFKKHWGKILALCIIVIVVTVFLARYFISKRKKNRKIKEAHQDQENIQWEQYFGNEGGAGVVVDASAVQAPAIQAPAAPAPAAALAPAAPQARPSQRAAIPPQIQQIQAQLAQHVPQQPPPPQPLQQQPRPVPPPLSAVQNGPQGQNVPQPQQAPPRPQQPQQPPQPVDPRLAAAGVSIPQRQPKEKEADLPKSDTDNRGRPIESTPPAGKVIDEIVVA